MLKITRQEQNLIRRYTDSTDPKEILRALNSVKLSGDDYTARNVFEYRVIVDEDAEYSTNLNLVTDYLYERNRLADMDCVSLIYAAEMLSPDCFMFSPDQFRSQEERLDFIFSDKDLMDEYEWLRDK